MAGRWADMEPAPEFEEGLRRAGLPVASCERQRHPPHHVRARFTRKLSLDEKARADKVKAAIRAGTLDALLNPKPKPTKPPPKPRPKKAPPPPKPRPKPKKAPPPKPWDNAKDLPELAQVMQDAGLPVTRCERMAQPPHWIRPIWERKPTGRERTKAYNLVDRWKKPKAPPTPNLKAPSKWDNSESLPELADEMRKAGLPVDWCERMTQPPHWIRTHFTRKPTTAEREKAYSIRHRLVNGKPERDKPKAITKTKPPEPLPPVKLTEDYSGANVELLATAVIEMAIRDAKAGDEEARLFLCAKEGAWATSRDAWAIVAGIDAALLHEWSRVAFAA